jgi:hypothetical protein
LGLSLAYTEWICSTDLLNTVLIDNGSPFVDFVLDAPPTVK